MQIRGDRRADLIRQRQLLDASSLAVHGDHSGPPVQVLQPQARHFAGAQSQPLQDEDDGVIAASDRGAPITRTQ